MKPAYPCLLVVLGSRNCRAKASIYRKIRKRTSVGLEMPVLMLSLVFGISLELQYLEQKPYSQDRKSVV